MKSSFFETLATIRGLEYHANLRNDSKSRRAAQRATEVFLKRRLCKTQREGNIMNPEFIKLHYPCYWHYDILFGLEVMLLSGKIQDNRCADALDLLLSKQLPDGGFPSDGMRFYRLKSSLVKWGESGHSRMNEFVTVNALNVLKEAGHLKLSEIEKK